MGKHVGWRTPLGAPGVEPKTDGQPTDALGLGKDEGTELPTPCWCSVSEFPPCPHVYSPYALLFFGEGAVSIIPIFRPCPESEVLAHSCGSPLMAALEHQAFCAWSTPLLPLGLRSGLLPSALLLLFSKHTEACPVIECDNQVRPHWTAPSMRQGPWASIASPLSSSVSPARPSPTRRC